MKKFIKVLLIILVILLVVIVVDSWQAKTFNNSPIIHITKVYSNCFKEDVGLFVETDVFSDGSKKTCFVWETKALILPGCVDSDD